MQRIRVRKATKNDDFLRMATCLYLTDPFIYPTAFGAELGPAEKAISRLMTIEEGLLSPEHMVVAHCDGEVCGILLYNRDGAKWDTDRYLEKVRDLLDTVDGFVRASEYFSEVAEKPPNGQIEIIACCVLPEYRGMGVGKTLMDWMIRENPDCTFFLDVLADNEPAIQLYQRSGFTIQHRFLGFGMSEETRPDCFRMMKNNHK